MSVDRRKGITEDRDATQPKQTAKTLRSGENNKAAGGDTLGQRTPQDVAASQFRRFTLCVSAVGIFVVHSRNS